MLTLLIGLAVGIAAGFAAGFGAASVARRGATTLVPPALPVREADVLRANLRDVRAGGLVRLRGFGDDFEDVDLEVERFHKDELGREEWQLLEGSYKNRAVGVEWRHERGETQAWGYKKLRQPLESVGLAPAALEALAPGKSHVHEGATFEVEAAGKALRHEGGDGFGKEHRLWVLGTKDGKRALRVEQWSGEPPRASLGEVIDPASIEIYKVKKA